MSGQTYNVVTPTNVALPPPPGVIPDFQDPFSLRPYHNVTASLALLFTGIFLILRLYTKTHVIKSLQWEDYTCTLAFLFYCGFAAMQFEVMNAKGGSHQWNVTSQEMQWQYRFTNYEDMMYPVAICFCKLSIILLVLRIFCPGNRDPLYWVLQGLNGLNIIFYIIFLFIPIFLCNPREKIWNKDVEGSCMNIFVLYIFSAAFNTFSDIAMFFVPLWRIWHLQMSRSRKVGVSAIFCCGAFAILASVFRLIFCVFLLTNADYSYVKPQSVLWTHGEVAFGIICSCLFVLPRFYRHLAAIPPYGTSAYHESQRLKSSGGTKNSGRKGRNMSLGDVEVEAPGVMAGARTWFDDQGLESGGSKEGEEGEEGDGMGERGIEWRNPTGRWSGDASTAVWADGRERRGVLRDWRPVVRKNNLRF